MTPPTTDSGSPADPFASLLKPSVERIGTDGRLTAKDARALRRSLREHPGDRSGLFAEPEGVLGPFDSLPVPGRNAVIDSVTRDGRWRMAAYDLGSLHARLSSSLWSLRNRLRRDSRAGQGAEVAAWLFRAGPLFALQILHRRFLAVRAKFERRPRLAEVLAAGGVEVRNLAVRYARSIPQLPSYRGFWHDAGTQTTVGLIVGVDLIRNERGYWVIEANMDCGLLAGRTAMYSEDPFVRNLLDFAATNGYRRLFVVSGATSVDAEMARQYREGGAARRIDVRLFENAFDPRFGLERTVGLPRVDEPGTLVVRNRHYRTPVDYLVHHKRTSSRALRIYREESGDGRFQLPVTSAEPRVDFVDADDPFPNLVFKFPELDDGEGVLFLKAASASQAKELIEKTLRAGPGRSRLSRFYAQQQDANGIYQPYVRTPMFEDRRLLKTRAYVLMTPIGAQYLSSQQTVCAKPVPAALPFGVIEDRGPFLVSYRPGSRWLVTPADEEAAVRDAALAVAQGLSRALEYGFQTGSRPEESK